MRERHVVSGALFGGLAFHCLEEGPPGAPLVLLLHGFPEIAWSWRRQLAYLGGRGLHAVAPDQRGYGESDRPRRVSDYDLDKLVDDVAGIADALGAKRVRLVGHDWGGAVAWQAASRYPELVEKLVILNCPPVHLMFQVLRRSPRQLARSWYTGFFQVPLLPERVLHGRRIARWMRRWAGDPDVFSDDDLARYVEAASRPGAMRSMLAWYRAGARRVGQPPPDKVRCPTRVVWGLGDKLLGPEFLDGMPAYVEGPLEIVQLPRVGHFVQIEAAEEVNRLLGEFL